MTIQDKSTWDTRDLNEMADGVLTLQSQVSTLQNGGSLTAVGDITISSDTDASGAGDIIISSGGVERARIKADGTVTGLAVASQVPTLAELVATSLLTANTGTATASWPVFIAPFACKITQASIMVWGNAIAASDTNFWTVAVRRMRANSSAVIAQQTTQVTGGTAIAQRTDWNFDGQTFSGTNQVLAKGDGVDFAWTATGTPTAATTVIGMVRYEPT